MARVSVSSMFLWDLDPGRMAEVIRDAGLEEMEFWAETPWYWEGGRRTEQAELINRELGGMITTLHAPVMDLNPSSYNDLVSQATTTESLRAIDLADFLGAEVVVVHPGKRTAKRPAREAEREKLLRYLDACLARAEERGVLLAIENLEPAPWNLCSDPDEMASFLGQYPLGMTLDISHATPPSSRAIAFVDALGGRILDVHVSATVNEVRHLPASTGSMDEVLTALRNAGYRGPLTLELDDKKFPETLSPEDKARVLKTERLHLESVFG